MIMGMRTYIADAGDAATIFVTNHLITLLMQNYYT